MPTRPQDANGEYPPVVTVTSSESFQAIKNAVIAGYENHLKTVIGNTPFNQLGEERDFKKLNSEFALKVAAELDSEGIKWSGKIGEDGNTMITVSKDDAEKLGNAIDTAKQKATQAANTNQQTQQAQPEPIPTAPKRH